MKYKGISLLNYALLISGVRRGALTLCVLFGLTVQTALNTIELNHVFDPSVRGRSRPGKNRNFLRSSIIIDDDGCTSCSAAASASVTTDISRTRGISTQAELRILRLDWFGAATPVCFTTIGLTNISTPFWATIRKKSVADTLLLGRYILVFLYH